MESRLSEEARLELFEHLAKLSTFTGKVAAAPPKPITRAPRAKQPSYTEYIRKEHGTDEVLLAFADVIDRNPGMWQAMCEFFKLNQSCGDGLRGWSVSRTRAVREPIIATVSLDIVDKEGTLRART